ncbi:hypothetical protein B0H14DRAFT_2606371 [Mycena olivaceomarginata]|nr:hypothetical protein B0H14DRAFT_2606371 [Mycena olivaceomarginata]
MARQTIPSALDSTGTTFISVLAAYEGVAKVEQLPVAVKHATLQRAIDRAESLTHDNRSAVKDGLYTLRDIVTTVTREQKFQAPKSHMAGISAMITFYETQIEANTVKCADCATNRAASKKSAKSPETVPDSDGEKIQSLVNALKSLQMDLDTVLSVASGSSATPESRVGSGTVPSGLHFTKTTLVQVVLSHSNCGLEAEQIRRILGWKGNLRLSSEHWLGMLD